MPPATFGHKAQILTVARRLFMTRGYRAVTTREIADAVGITQPALYHHFGGKEALYLAVLDEELATESAAMWGAARLDAPPVDRLASLAAGVAQRAEYDLSQMFHDLRFEVSEETRRRVGAGFRDAMVTPLISVLEALEGEGLIGGPEETGLTRPEAAMYVLSVIRMLTEADSGPARGPERTPAEIGTLTVQLVLRGMGPSNA